MVMMSTRKLHCHVRHVSSSSVSLFIGLYCEAAGYERCGLPAHWSHRSISQAKGSQFTHSHVQDMVLDWHFFSTTAANLVQSADPGKQCMELVDASKDHRLTDMMRLCDQHMAMDGFPRKSTANKDELYLKLAKTFISAGKTKDLAELLIEAEKEGSLVSPNDSISVIVIKSCVSFGWVDQAHYIINEMLFAGIGTDYSSLCTLLMNAFIKENRPREVKSLLKDVHNARIQIDLRCYEEAFKSQVLQAEEISKATLPRAENDIFLLLVRGCEGGSDPMLMLKLLRKIKVGPLDCGLDDWNGVIKFFCGKRLMDIAGVALKKMTSFGHDPNAQTFRSLAIGYAAIDGRFQEAIDLWDEMKYATLLVPMKSDQEVLEAFLYKFVRGGFFDLANEVTGVMEKEKMMVNKHKYQFLFLKYHKKYCAGKFSRLPPQHHTRTRAAGLAFKRWVSWYGSDADRIAKRHALARTKHDPKSSNQKSKSR